VSQWRPMMVWTEHEGPGTPKDEGDFEACVATSYAMGLLYGGATMPAPYTQAERERLEVVANAPQDLSASDVKALEVYGHRLRGPSVTSSKAAFLARPGLGFCLTGVGSPVGAQAGTFLHEVFAVAVSFTEVRVYDPLRPEGSQPTNLSVNILAAWMLGLGDDQVREIDKDEFTGANEMELKGTMVRPTQNRKTTVKLSGVMVTDPTAMPFDVIRSMPAGQLFVPDWLVTGNTILGSSEWYGGWEPNLRPGVALTFGYVSVAICNPLEPIEGTPN
jgi:hypothetical protein